MDSPIATVPSNIHPAHDSSDEPAPPATIKVRNRRGRPTVFVRDLSSLSTPVVFKRKSSGEPLICDVCQKAFKSQSILTTHLRKHTGEKPFRCSADGCNEAFRTQSQRARHVRTHTGIKSHFCDVEGCQSSFTSSSNLTKHRRVKHEGMKSYKCDICFKCFGYLTNFNNHYRSHTGEKPYACLYPACGGRFAEYSTALKHVLFVHTEERCFKCDKCPHSFRSKDGLKYHVRRKHLEPETTSTVSSISTGELRSLILQEMPELASVLTAHPNDVLLQFELEQESAVLLGFHEENELEDSAGFSRS